MIYVYRLLTGVIFAIFAAPLFAQPSIKFDGNLARTEKAICGSRNLSKLDRDLDQAYRDE